jgi:dihydroneopterin aldolase/2-amino-4-hydroxy-6-hydroxymethyldihydropteridine diphosphokinase
MATTYLCLGSNLGDRKSNIKRALEEIGKSGINIVRKSSLYETEPTGIKAQPLFFNLCAEAETALAPRALLAAVKSVEASLGRQKTMKWGPRIIDIDILFYDNIILKDEGLVIPHPEIENRKFVLVPMSEIAADFVHPALKITIKELSGKKDFAEKVKRLEP